MRAVAVIWEQVNRKTALCKASYKDFEADKLAKSQTEHTLFKNHPNSVKTDVNLGCI